VIHATDLMHSASDGTVSLCRPESLRHEAIHLLYWASLGACFFLWRRCAPVGWLCLYTVFFVAWLCPFLSPLGPLDWGGRAFGPTGLRPWQEPNGEATASKAVTPYRCYPYFHALTLLADREGRRRALANVSLASALKRQPILYVFGEDKNAHWQPSSRAQQRGGETALTHPPRLSQAHRGGARRLAADGGLLRRQRQGRGALGL